MRNEKRNRNSQVNRVSLSAIRSLAKQIAELFDVDKIILFGSYAYGKPTKASDVDLLVVMNTKKRRVEHRLEIVRALSPIHFGIDIFVRNEEEILRRISLGDWFL